MAVDFDRLIEEVHRRPLSASLPKVLRLAEAIGDSALATWVRLELLGYLSSNPAMTERTMVPEYRTVGGQWFDTYGRPLLITDPNLAFINETRLRSSVLELEGFVGTTEILAIQIPDHSALIRDNLGVEVTTFRFSPTAVSQVLANIKAHLLDCLVAIESSLESALESMRAVVQDDEILELRPNVWGIGVNLKALWRKWRSQLGEE
jgi:hypothetical protein